MHSAESRSGIGPENVLCAGASVHLLALKFYRLLPSSRFGCGLRYLGVKRFWLTFLLARFCCQQGPRILPSFCRQTDNASTVSDIAAPEDDALP